MPEALHTGPIPRGTRIALDTVWSAFGDGATAEEIVQQYPSLSLADACQAPGYLSAASLGTGGIPGAAKPEHRETGRSNEAR
ncbi:MAG: DUF433 domain-containing protein [Acidobacteriia bacterium]|nr:DUF433 domain-containing protein [Terriglobia bacterium]